MEHNSTNSPWDERRNARQHSEASDPLRDPFELDRHRIINCTAFRRLQHKTQVFAPSMHDHFRNRLTHTLEVAQIARCLARNWGADQNLCEAISLAHDLGHPPFSHAGEKALNQLMAGHGGFNHNAHSARVVEYLEHPYPVFRGLNLTFATLDGLRAHATQYDEPTLEQPTNASREAQIVSLADRMAYDLHDLEDAIGATLITENQLTEIPIWRDACHDVIRDFGTMKLHAVRRPVIDAILDRLLSDSLSSISNVKFSAACETALRELEASLHSHVYHHPDVSRADAEG